MNLSVVLGGCFGDEGKGITVDYLTVKSRRPLVIRHNGSSQAGHTVVVGDNRHVFSHFGSGTLRGAPTFWSRYCPVQPLGLMTEYYKLKLIDIQPAIYVDPLAPVITPYDIFYNRFLERSRGSSRHGSCGVGFGCTVERYDHTPYKIFAQDLFHYSILKQKLKSVEEYYKGKFNTAHRSFSSEIIKEHLEKYFESVEDSKKIIQFESEQRILKENVYAYDHFIFEGAQGILLDQNFGFFPNVTRSNTTSQNALEIIKRNGLKANTAGYPRPPEIYYVTRAYQTRHGNGFMSNEAMKPELEINNEETNVYNQWQGHLRKGLLDLDLINYALQCDNNFSYGCSKTIVVTCLDQLKGDWRITYNNNHHTIFADEAFMRMLKFGVDKFLKCYAPDSEAMSELSIEKQKFVQYIYESQK